ncbi:MAG: bifunctional O-acetylhomoserine aminocarboxypropyltransferase/cysteine synthase [Deltaproteobacteria bacterium]|nr:MAG: bifunctional O-acetylhomoserine aminocarboxypropyltransferase/cysteine synthase [Deltaproteobacteria bacterium]
MLVSEHKFETQVLHAGAVIDETCARTTPLHRTSSYLFKNSEHAADLFALREPGNIYSRMMNPTQSVLEERLAALEGGAGALALASGTSAVFYTVINICRQGDEVVAARNVYGGTYTMFNNILPQFGIRVRFVDPLDCASIEAAINTKTRMIFIESIGNPKLDVVNLVAVAEIARTNKLPLVVDSTFTTPYLCRPLEYGADIVIHSLTKWLGGHGAGIGGIVVDGGNFNWQDERFSLYNTPDNSYQGLKFSTDLGDQNHLAFILRMRLVALRNLGACLSPDNAWIFMQGIETLPLRMQRHCENALNVAEYLESNPLVDWVRYPGLKSHPTHQNAVELLRNGFGGVVVFGIKGGKLAGEKFIDSLSLFSHLANVGDAKSLAIHPAGTTHSQLSEKEQNRAGVDQELIRLSIGIEHIDDIIADLEQAIEKSVNGD